MVASIEIVKNNKPYIFDIEIYEGYEGGFEEIADQVIDNIKESILKIFIYFNKKRKSIDIFKLSEESRELLLDNLYWTIVEGSV